VAAAPALGRTSNAFDMVHAVTALAARQMTKTTNLRRQ